MPPTGSTTLKFREVGNTTNDRLHGPSGRAGAAAEARLFATKVNRVGLGRHRDDDEVEAAREAIRAELEKTGADPGEIDDYLSELGDDEVVDGDPEEHFRSFMARPRDAASVMAAAHARGAAGRVPGRLNGAVTGGRQPHRRAQPRPGDECVSDDTRGALAVLVGTQTRPY
jgi:hypothetical protein